MALGQILSLSGLVLDFLGAFLLAVNALGRQRLFSWALNLRFSPAAFASYLIVAASAGVAVPYMAWKWAPALRGYDPFIQIVFIAAAFVATIPLAAAVAIAADFLFDRAARFIEWAQLQEERQRAAVLGFGLLATGFLLQFTGGALAALD